MTRSARASTDDVIVAHVLTIIITAAVMWALHSGEHSSPVVFAVGAGVYGAMVGGAMSVARHRADRRSERQRANMAAYTAQHNRGLYGRG